MDYDQQRLSPDSKNINSMSAKFGEGFEAIIARPKHPSLTLKWPKEGKHHYIKRCQCMGMKHRVNECKIKAARTTDQSKL